ncbi:MAG TPA: hypothetical protein VLG41_16575 [Hydrogenophaga sp.]|uniref:COG4648 family protein n=1 Tax=Hydrogenophaga sp. TaxID=1904254 RepID=UPI002BEEF46B|nr:hypothetical protein [Hydrogenophaga sp.]HSX94546.1 hypothetical protein [Hydrogenophaga sp.]
MKSLRAAASALLLLGWIAASHLGSTGRGPVDLHVAVAVAPFLAALGILFARLARPALKLLAWLAVGALLWGLWPLLRTQVALLYYLQHLGIHLALAALFGASLTGSGDALVTRLARFVSEGELSPRHVRYTRQVTAAWAAFFVLNALVSTALFLFAPREVWSLHANVLTGPLVGLVFLIEALCRRAVLPPHERPSLSAVVRAWRAVGQHRPADPRSQS